MKKFFINIITVVITLALAGLLLAYLLGRLNQKWEAEVKKLTDERKIERTNFKVELFGLTVERKELLEYKTDAMKKMDKLKKDLGIEKNKPKYIKKEIPIYYEHSDLKKCRIDFNLCLQTNMDLEIKVEALEDNHEKIVDIFNEEYVKEQDHSKQITIKFKNELKRIRLKLWIAIPAGLIGGFIVGKAIAGR